MDESRGIETRLPDMGRVTLEELEKVENPMVRQAVRRLAQEAARPLPPSSGFSSSVLATGD